MSSAEDALRLAWRADRDGRAGMRDALLTLALAESGPDDAVAAERCRKFLVAGRPHHWLASFPTLGQALAHPRVAGEIRLFRAMYPPVRVRHLLRRSDVLLGPYTGRRVPRARILDDLFGPRTPRQAPAGDSPPSALPFATGSAGTVERPDDPEDLSVFYLTVLLAIAILLATVPAPAAQGTRAA